LYLITAITRLIVYKFLIIVKCGNHCSCFVAEINPFMS